MALIVENAVSGAERNLSLASLAALGMKREDGGGRSLATLEMTKKRKAETIEIAHIEIITASRRSLRITPVCHFEQA